jgi:DNA-binding MarR family transcriptional regulator
VDASGPHVSSVLSPSLRKLIDTHIESFEKLELLMFLRRAPGERATSGELARALELDAGEVRSIVAQLSAAGLVARAADGAVAPAPQHQAALDELARVYDEDKIELVKAIAEAAMDRLRNLAGRAFAEAFVIRRKPGGDDDR